MNKNFFCTLFLLAFAGALSAEQAEVISNQAAVYADKDQGSVVLDVLPASIKVDLIATEGEWVRIYLPGTAEMGWVQRRLLRQVGAAQESKVSPSAGPPPSRQEIDRFMGEMDKVDDRLWKVQQRIDSIIVRVQKRQAAYPAPQPSKVQKSRGKPKPVKAPVLGRYNFGNRFLMGKYLRGKDDFYGLGFSRALDKSGIYVLDSEFRYVPGETGGDSNHLDWGAGLRCNVFPDRYLIYPFLVALAGARHHLENRPAQVSRMFLCEFGGGVSAELGDLFVLNVDLRAVLLFPEGRRRGEGLVAFSCMYRY